MKMFRPFWSFDILKTEQWLAEMAHSGFFVFGLNRWTRCFHFNKSDDGTQVYRISYDKLKSPILPKTLQIEGWKTAFSTGKWQVIANSQPEQTLRNSPSRDAIVKRNRTIMYIFYGLLFYVAGMLLANISTLISSWLQDDSIAIEESPYWILTFLFLGSALGFAALAVYSIRKITKTNRLLEDDPTNEIDDSSEGFSKQDITDLKRSGRWVTKLRLSWMYSPDKLENWLESMELRGFNLHHINNFGTIFHFTKGKPRRIVYRVDCQSNPSASYFSIHRDSGWTSHFTSLSNLEKWTIWSQEYAKEQERPQLYSDDPTRLRKARKLALTYTALFLPFILIYIVNLSNSLNTQNGTGEWLSWGTAIFLLCIGVFGSFLVRIWTYYMRLRKQITA